jgi:PAP2 superfamily
LVASIPGQAKATNDLARWVAAGELRPATRHAHWVLGLEGDLGLAVEHSVQGALDGGVVVWLLSNIYLAAQLVVLPGALIYLYRRAPDIYRRLRDTVLATWLLAVPIYALFPVAPPRLAGIGMADTVSKQAGVALTGHSTIFYDIVAGLLVSVLGYVVGPLPPRLLASNRIASTTAAVDGRRRSLVLAET